MATIQEMKEKMTIFFYKRTGTIQCLVTGIQDMSLFGDYRLDYELIIDYIVVPYDENILKNRDDYFIKNNELISKIEEEQNEKLEQVRKEKEELENQLILSENKGLENLGGIL